MDEDLNLLRITGHVEAPGPEVLERARQQLLRAMQETSEAAAAAHAVNGAAVPGTFASPVPANEVHDLERATEPDLVAETLPATEGRTATVAGEARRHRRRANLGPHHPWSRRLVTSVSVGVVVVATAIATIPALLHNPSNGAGRPAGTLGPAVTVPPVMVPAGFVPSDFGLLRLYYSKDWRPLDGCRAVSRPDGTGSGKDSPTAELIERLPHGFTQCSDALLTSWISLRPMQGTAPKGWVASVLNGITVWSPPPRAGVRVVTDDIPSLHVQLQAFGSAALRSVHTLGPSALSAVLRLRRPVSVPKQWKQVSFDGVSAWVPKSWPLEHLARTGNGGYLDPGVCGGAVFGSSFAAIGNDPLEPPCPLIEPTLITATSGYWNDGSPSAPGATAAGITSETGDRYRALGFGPAGTTIRFSYSGNQGLLDAFVPVHGKKVVIVVGLGTDPRIAEAVLSSLTVG